MAGIGAALAGGIAQHLTPATAITTLAAVSVTVTVLSRPFVAHTRSVVRPGLCQHHPGAGG